MPALAQEAWRSDCGAERPVRSPTEAHARGIGAGHLGLRDRMYPTAVGQRRDQDVLEIVP